MWVCVYVLSCSVMSDSLDYSWLGSSVHGISQARVLEWVAISFSRESSRSRDQTHISCSSCTGRQILYHCATWEALKTSQWLQELLNIAWKNSPWGLERIVINREPKMIGKERKTTTTTTPLRITAKPQLIEQFLRARSSDWNVKDLKKHETDE